MYTHNRPITGAYYITTQCNQHPNHKVTTKMKLIHQNNRKGQKAKFAESFEDRDVTLMPAMVGTPGPGATVPDTKSLMYRISHNINGFRDDLIRMAEITGQTPALLAIWQRALCQHVRHLDMQAAQHARGIELAQRKHNG
jgi:hypothetical protein